MYKYVGACVCVNIYMYALSGFQLYIFFRSRGPRLPSALPRAPLAPSPWRCGCRRASRTRPPFPRCTRCATSAAWCTTAPASMPLFLRRRWDILFIYIVSIYRYRYTNNTLRDVCSLVHHCPHIDATLSTANVRYSCLSTSIYSIYLWI